MDKFEISYHVSASPTQLYELWTTSEGHAKMIDNQAEIKPEVNEEFSMWDGYITGKNIELKTDEKIVQAWRTTEFPADAEDSNLTIVFVEQGSGTRMKMIHSNIPAGQGPQYKQGWKDHYLDRLDQIFK